MARWLDPQRMAPLATVVLAVLLVVLGVVQHRWIAEVSLAEQQRMREGLEMAAGRLAGELDHEVARAFFFFQPEPPGHDGDPRARLVQQLRNWRSTAPYPELIRDVFVATR